jgi:prefoldin alpha subunit
VNKEKMFEAEMLHQQLERLQEYMERLDRQVAEVLNLKEGLDKFQEVKEGTEVLVPLASGVFVRTLATDDKVLQVNVGQGNVVPKTMQQMHEMLDEQLGEMREYEKELHRQFDQALAKLQKIQTDFAE